LHPNSQAVISGSEGLSHAQPATGGVGATEIRVKGKNVVVPSVQVLGTTVIRTGRWPKLAAVHDESLVECEAVVAPASFMEVLKRTGLKADIFTFAQKLPDLTPKYPYHMEWDNLAVIPITTFSHWWERRIKSAERAAVRKAAKTGVVVKQVEFDDALVGGIVKINNETPIRQGKPFWHFSKSFDAVKRESSTYAERNTFLGAYYHGELIGVVRITYSGKIAHIIQFLASMRHYDKSTANAMIAKAVEVCEGAGISYLAYGKYVYHGPESSLTEFKRRNGFEQVLVPRYFIPLTLSGTIAIRFGLHRGLKRRIPKPLLVWLLGCRNWWYTRGPHAGKAGG
jgi:hypothetical protein